MLIRVAGVRLKRNMKEMERDVEQTGESARCLLRECPHKRKLKETLAEAIEALEKTKAAFKSKQIELLRKKLMRVLLEECQ